MDAGEIVLSGNSHIYAKTLTVSGGISGNKHYLNYAQDENARYFGAMTFTEMTGPMTMQARAGKEYLQITPCIKTIVTGGVGGGAATIVEVSMPLVQLGSKEADAIRTLQTRLNALGYDCGTVDGVFGSKTYAAVVAFQKATGLTVDGIFGQKTLAAVKAYQADHALSVDGVVGNQTWGALL